MKVALLAPIHTAKIIGEVVRENLDYIELETIIYDNYTSNIETVKNIQKKYDGIMFTGVVLYNFVKTYVKEECIWGHFPLREDALAIAFLQALHLRKNITNISIDTYSIQKIKDIYNTINIDIDDVNLRLCDVDCTSMNILEDVTAFHKKSLEQDKNVCIITALSDVNKSLEDQGIQSHMIIPTKSVIVDTFQNMYLRYTAKINTNSRLVAIFIEIDFPSEYSIVGKNEYYYIKEKNKVTEKIYEFASKIEAAVIEFSYNTYIMISTKQILETETDNFMNIELLKSINKSSLNRISVGVGYGKTASEAKYRANNAMRKATEYKDENIAYVIYEDGRTIGPIRPVVEKKKEVVISDNLLQISNITGVSINKILAFYNAIDICKKNEFTTSELSKQCNMSYRTVNRTINKLENFGYIEVVGRHFEEGSGRPKRIIQFKF